MISCSVPSFFDQFQQSVDNAYTITGSHISRSKKCRRYKLCPTTVKLKNSYDIAGDTLRIFNMAARVTPGATEQTLLTFEFTFPNGVTAVNIAPC